STLLAKGRCEAVGPGVRSLAFVSVCLNPATELGMAVKIQGDCLPPTHRFEKSVPRDLLQSVATRARLQAECLNDLDHVRYSQANSTSSMSCHSSPGGVGHPRRRALPMQRRVVPTIAGKNWRIAGPFFAANALSVVVPEGGERFTRRNTFSSLMTVLRAGSTPTMPFSGGSYVAGSGSRIRGSAGRASFTSLAGVIAWRVRVPVELL